MIKKVLRSILRAIFSIFYDPKYLSGRWFEVGIKGWTWALKGIGNAPWPSAIKIVLAENIHFHPDDLNNFQSPGVNWQAYGHIYMGKGSLIGPNVGLITANHDPSDLQEHLPAKDICIGEHCWIGMNSVILPGVVLGDNTIVGAGSVVTHSFPKGHCVIAGNPAEIIKSIQSSSSAITSKA